MIRTLLHRLLLCSLLVPAGAFPASGQGAAATIARAQQTLDEIGTLIDGIHARSTSSVASSRSEVGAGWEDLFDGASLAGWRRTDFGGGGAAHVEKSFRGGPAAIVVDAGSSLSGINWNKDAPRTNYEIAIETLKIQGGDFVLGLTFPVGDAYASLILGGWGGTVTGISSIDGHDASENETSRLMSFEKDRWFAVRMRVTPAKLEAWIDGKKIVDEEIAGKRISLRRGEISKSVPIGLSTYQTSSAFRAIRLHRLESQ